MCRHHCNEDIGCSSYGINIDHAKNMVKELTSTIFELRKTLASLNYYMVLSQRLSLKTTKVDIGLRKD
jgi:hypothetical protein